jgi:predicted metalloprotease with PDZ domain
MRADDREDKSVEQIFERLKSSYSMTEPAMVDEVVKAARDSLRDSRIRDFVPILIERRARAALDGAGERRQRFRPE